MSRQTASAPAWAAVDHQARPPAADHQGTTRQTTSRTTRSTTRQAPPDHQAAPPATTTSTSWRSPAVYHQAPPATHRIVAPPDHQALDHQVDHQAVEGAGAPANLREQFADACNGLRFVHQSPGSLRDQIEYARDGAYTVRAYGWWRTVNIGFARFVAAPGLTVCYLAAWAFFTRLSRAFISWLVLAFLLMFLNRIPLAEMFVPDWADFTNWL